MDGTTQMERAECGVTPEQVGTPSADPGLGLVGALPSTLPATGLCASCLRLQFQISGPRQAGRVMEPTWHVAFVHRGSRLQENVTLGSLDSEGSHCHKAVSSVGTTQHPLWEL